MAARCDDAAMSAQDPERLDDLALLIAPRLRRRHVRGGMEAKLRFAGQRATVVLSDDLKEASFHDIVGALIDDEAELAAVADDRDRWLERQDPELSDRELRERWRRMERNARELRTLLGPELARFAAAERPPPERRAGKVDGPGGPGGFRYPWA